MSRLSFAHVDELHQLVARFADCSLACEEFTHQAHLVVGLWHAWNFPADEALDRVRASIQRFNAACKVPESPTRGYHETITRFYITYLSNFVAAAEDRTDLLRLAEELLAAHGDRDLPLRYYTRERLFSAEARAGWLPPDLQPLPEA